jgi:hypothetical protein
MFCYLIRKIRFRQHLEAPFGTGERKAKHGLDCTSDDAKALLNGSYDRELENLSDEARCWLQQLQREPFTRGPKGVISSAIETDEWIAGWSKMRESTASAPGGHYGHYKTAAVIAKLPADHEDYFPDLAETYAAMTPYRSSMDSLQRVGAAASMRSWKKSLGAQ